MPQPQHLRLQQVFPFSKSSQNNLNIELHPHDWGGLIGAPDKGPEIGFAKLEGNSIISLLYSCQPKLPKHVQFLIGRESYLLSKV
jgi:hypothetical protein